MRNAIKAQHRVVEVPASNLKKEITKILFEKGYILNYKFVEGEVAGGTIKIALKYDIPLDVLMFGEEPHMSSYFLTRKGKGLSVERRKAYQYESLASGFRGRKADPFIVTVEPKPADTPIETNTHAGQEFNMVLEGDMELTIGKKTLTLHEGDSIIFDSTQPHGMRTLGESKVRFLAIIF